MDSNKFWVSINAILVSGFVLVVYLGTIYWNNHNNKIVKMVADGVDPVAAMCAMQNDHGKMPVCLVLATKTVISGSAK